MNREEFDQTISIINDIVQHRNSCIRAGQAYFNETYSILLKKGISIEQLTGSDADCFYDDTKIPKFIEKVRELCVTNLLLLIK